MGIGTVLADDPMLNCRIEGGRDPIRIICDTHLKTPVTSKIVKTAKDIPTIIACCVSDEELQRPYKEAGCKILLTEKKMGHIDLQHLMELLGKEKIDKCLQKDERRNIEQIKTALSISKGNLTQAAALLGISRPTLYKRMSLHGISR